MSAAIDSKSRSSRHDQTEPAPGGADSLIRLGTKAHSKDQPDFNPIAETRSVCLDVPRKLLEAILKNSFPQFWSRRLGLCKPSADHAAWPRDSRSRGQTPGGASARTVHSQSLRFTGDALDRLMRGRVSHMVEALAAVECLVAEGLAAVLTRHESTRSTQLGSQIAFHRAADRHRFDTELTGAV